MSKIEDGIKLIYPCKDCEKQNCDNCKKTWQDIEKIYSDVNESFMVDTWRKKERKVMVMKLLEEIPEDVRVKMTIYLKYKKEIAKKINTYKGIEFIDSEWVK